MEKRVLSDRKRIRRLTSEDRQMWKDQISSQYEIIAANRDYPYFRDKILTGERALSAMKSGYFNRDILETVRQYNDYYLNLPNYKDFSSNLRVHEYISDLIPFSSGRVGNVDYVEVRKENSILGTKVFVVKTSRKVDFRGLIHEYFIGLMGTNNLRRYIPNFVYTMGLFQCSAPVRDNGRISYCLKGESVDYLIYENVTNWEYLINFLYTSTKSKFFNILNQVIYSLAMADEQIGFVHGDLIPGNILVKKLPDIIQIEYTINGRSTWIKTDIVATVIDYGSSIIDYGDRVYNGSPNVDMNGYFDVHTILMSAAYVITRADKMFIKDVLDYVRLFTDEDPYLYLKEGLAYQYKTKVMENFSYSDFIDLWRETTPSFDFISFSPFEDVNVFGESEFMKDYFIKDYSNPYYFVDSLNYRELDEDLLRENYQHYIDFLDKDIRRTENEELKVEKIRVRELIKELSSLL